VTSGVGPCRSCGAELRHSVVDLGLQPLANSYLEREQLDEPEPVYPLHPYVCDTCWLVQLQEFASPDEIFSDYAYFSSYSDSWLEHARVYAEEMIDRLGLGPDSLVVEVASNDGYLLRNFVSRGIPVLGIEPAKNVAEHAIAAGVPTEIVFLGRETALELQGRGVAGDLVVGNNVLAHVPDLNDFVSGLATLLAPDGTLTMEFPHLLRLVEEHQFDTIYHEHYSYLSLTAVQHVFARHELAVEDVEELATHGGSLRVFAGHAARNRGAGVAVERLLERERDAQLLDVRTYERLGRDANAVRDDLVAFLREARGDGRSVVGYGAPAKGNTLLNYCGVKPDLLAYTVDRSPHKQGRFLPGSHVPIHAPEHLLADRPDFVLILPWNLKDEIVEQLSAVREWGGRFVVPIPEVRVL
jgi:SAM-dependent methyltransferase